MFPDGALKFHGCFPKKTKNFSGILLARSG